MIALAFMLFAISGQACIGAREGISYTKHVSGHGKIYKNSLPTLCVAFGSEFLFGMVCHDAHEEPSEGGEYCYL